MTDSQIGTLFSPHLIEEAALSELQRYLPLYRLEAQSQYGVKLPEIQSWGLQDEEEARLPDTPPPALVVVAQPVQDIEKHSEGWYRAAWPFDVRVLMAHPELVKARLFAQVYGAVVRGVLLQRRSLGGIGRADWVGESTPFEKQTKQTVAMTQNSFVVTREEVVNWQLGPKEGEVPEAPLPGAPEITEVDVVDVEVEK